MNDQPILRWEFTQANDRFNESVWNLRLRYIDDDDETCWRSVATVWENGTWHTWGRDGAGGENSREDSVWQARLEAANSAITQGFI